MNWISALCINIKLPGSAWVNLISPNVMCTNQCVAVLHSWLYLYSKVVLQEPLLFPIWAITIMEKNLSKASLQIVTQRRDSLLIHSNVMYINMPTTMNFSLIMIYRPSLIHISTYISIYVSNQSLFNFFYHDPSRLVEINSDEVWILSYLHRFGSRMLYDKNS